MCHSANRRGIFVARVVANGPLCREHFQLRLSMKTLPPTRPGQFVQLQCRPLRDQVSSHAVDWPERQWPRLTQPELADKEPLLRRPLSIAGRRDLPDGTVELTLIYRSVGTGTTWLSHIGEGTELSVLGPLGNGFTVHAGKPMAVLIGGGVGIPPMMYLSESLVAAGKKVVAFCGTRNASLLPLTLVPGVEVSPVGKPALCTQQFAHLGIPTVIATDDGSIGVPGMVTESFRDWLNLHLPAEGELTVYSCGPEPMMRALAEVCLSRGYECQVALERHMACGMGTCQSCVVKLRDETERGWSFKLCCTDGPVFDAKDLMW